MKLKKPTYNPEPGCLAPAGVCMAAIQGMLISFKIIGADFSWFAALLPLELIVAVFLICTAVLFALHAASKRKRSRTFTQNPDPQ